MNVHTLYYNRRQSEFYDPFKPSAPRVNGLLLPILDLIRIRLAVVDGYARVDSTGKPLATWQATDLATMKNAIISLKQKANYISSSQYPVDFSSQGFDTSDSAWHNPANGMFTLGGIVLPLSVLGTGQAFNNSTYPSSGPANSHPRGRFVAEIALIDVDNSSFSIGGGYLGFLADIIDTVGLGTASSAPVGAIGGTGGNFTIADPATSAVIPITGMTATGQIVLATLPSTGSPQEQQFYADYSVPGQVTVSVQNQPGPGNSYNGRFTILRLA